MRVLAKRYGINQKTVAKWKQRTAVKDLPTGPRDAHSTVLTIEEEAAHLHDFINAYNYGRRLKTLRGLTPYEYICKTWKTEPERFTLDPHHQRPGPNT